MKKIMLFLTLIVQFIFAFGQTENGSVNNVKIVEAVSLPVDTTFGPDAARTMAVNQISGNNIPNPTLLCTACSTIKVTVPASSTILFYNNNTFTLSHTMTISSTPTRYVRNIKAELDYFEYLPDAENCMTCNKNSATFGNIMGGTIGAVVGAGNGTHNYEVNYAPARAPGSFPVALTISMPPTVNCCAGTLRICVRYVVTFDDCTVCTQSVCYEKKKTGSLLAVPINMNPS